MNEDQRRDLLQAEYFKLQDFVEKFDERALQIKGWSITVSLAAIVAAYSTDKAEIVANRPIILAIAAISAAAFWSVEFIWKSFQWTFFHRIEAIEAALRNGTEAQLAPLQIRYTWHHHFKKELRYSFGKRKMFKPSIALPHVIIMIAAIALLIPTMAKAAVDHVIVSKTGRTLVLVEAGKTIKTYRNIKLGDAPVGHKQFQGDEKTPEGVYRISGRNPGSRFHLSLRISYPNAADRRFAAARGRDPGGDIFIHGQPNGFPLTRLPNDWTDGCIALSNAEIREIWRLVPDGTRITIRP
jgi:lipoprotein-anchoring transpeptidase ErfK/SrfK